MRHSAGFSLLEVLIVVTIIGMLAAMGLPSLLEALDRGRQTSTVADMKEISTALERYAVDYQKYPEVEAFLELRPLLEPKYIKKLPREDGWGHAFTYGAEEEGGAYRLSSPGKDGEWEGAGEEKEKDFDSDIICVDGVFLDEEDEA